MGFFHLYRIPVEETRGLDCYDLLIGKSHSRDIAFYVDEFAFVCRIEPVLGMMGSR